VYEMKHSSIFLIIIILTLIPGCERTKIIDKLSIVHTLGYDTKDGNMGATVLYPDYTQSKNKQDIQIRNVEGATSSELLAHSNQQTQNPIELSKTIVIVFGEGFAKKGVGHIIRTVFNNPTIGTSVQTAVVKPNAKEFLKKVKENGTLSIAETITQNYRTLSMPQTDLHIFLNNYYGAGKDPYMPVLSHGTEKSVKIEGLAIFKDDQYKLHLKEGQYGIFALLDPFKHQVLFEIPIKKGEKKGIIGVRELKNKPSWKVTDDHSIKVKLNLKVKIREYPGWLKLNHESDIKLIKTAIEKKLKSEIIELVQLFKENGVDPLGLGDLIRSHDRAWDEDEFYKNEYKQLKVEPDITLTIIQAGIRK
jgi:spore germination protein